MKKIIIAAIAIILAINPLSAMDEDVNPFSRNAVSQPIKNVKYEPLEVEMVDVSDNPKPHENKPWYKSRRFWCGAAIATTVVATIAGITYAVYNSLEKEDDHPLLNSPSASPMPSFINNITESMTCSISDSISAIASKSSSWSGSLSSLASRSMSALESLTSTVTSTVTRTISSTFSPTPSVSEYWESVGSSRTRTVSPSPSSYPCGWLPSYFCPQYAKSIYNNFCGAFIPGMQGDLNYNNQTGGSPFNYTYNFGTLKEYGSGDRLGLSFPDVYDCVDKTRFLCAPIRSPLNETFSEGQFFKANLDHFYFRINTIDRFNRRSVSSADADCLTLIDPDIAQYCPTYNSHYIICKLSNLIAIPPFDN